MIYCLRNESCFVKMEQNSSPKYIAHVSVCSLRRLTRAKITIFFLIATDQTTKFLYILGPVDLMVKSLVIKSVFFYGSYMACKTRKGTFRHSCKVLSWISLCSPRRLIQDSTLQLHKILCHFRLFLNRKKYIKRKVSYKINLRGLNL